MRKALGALIVLAVTLMVAPAPAATSATGVDRGSTQTDRRGDLDAVRQGVVDLINNRRRNHDCNNLARNGDLDQAAQTHTRKMANRNQLEHELPGEPSLGTRVRRAGYDWTMVAENIASGYATPAAVVQGWMNSSGHRRNILNCRYRHIGVGYAVTDGGTPYWTTVFGRR